MSKKEIEIGKKKMILETSLSRIYQHSKNGFFIVSAFRGGLSFEENLKRDEELEGEIKNLGLGYIKLLGTWKEDDKIEHEYSFFIPYFKEYDPEEFEKIVLELGKTFSQYAIIYCPPDGSSKIFLMKPNREILKEFTKTRFNQAIEEYSETKKSGKRFRLEGFRVPQNHIDAFAFEDRNEITGKPLFFKIR